VKPRVLMRGVSILMVSMAVTKWVGPAEKHDLVYTLQTPIVERESRWMYKSHRIGMLWVC